MKTASNVPHDWHPDLNTALVWRPYVRQQRKSDALHYLKVVALTLLLAGSGFAAVMVLRYVVFG